MQKKDFLKALGKIEQEPFKQRAGNVLAIFQAHDDEWVSLLKSLRDRIAHRDMLSANFESQEKIVTFTQPSVLFNWPTIKGRTYDRLCQDSHNGIFLLIVDTLPVLFDIEWKPGPYIPGMFGEK